MPNDPGRHVPLRRSRSTSDIVRGAVVVNLPERAAASTSRRDRRVFSVDGSMSLTITPPTTATQSPWISNDTPFLTMQRANEPTGTPSSPLRHSFDQETSREQRLSLSSRTAAFFGLGQNATRQRKLQMGLVQALVWNFIQVRHVQLYVTSTTDHL
jgi:hypothetical protein